MRWVFLVLFFANLSFFIYGLYWYSAAAAAFSALCFVREAA